MNKRLRETLLQWQEKVGVRFDIEDFEKDYDEPQPDGMEEFD